MATCRSSHSKHPRTVTNHSPRSQRVPDAPSTSGSSSSSCSPEGHSSSVVPVHGDSASEVCRAFLTPTLSASYTSWPQTLEHGWVHAQVAHTMAWAHGGSSSVAPTQSFQTALDAWQAPHGWPTGLGPRDVSQQTELRPPQANPPQRWPPVLRDNRFFKDRSRRVYICDHCHAHVPWSGQAKAFDGAYLTYDNKSPIELLPQQWEQGRDFRWFCTMCYARWWNMNDLGEVRQRLGLMAKVEARKARAEKWREKGCVDAKKRH